jgi:transglutaminase-like putative cysteine protease
MIRVLICRSLLALFVLALFVLALFVLAFAREALADPPAVRKVHLKYRCEITKVPQGAKSVDLWIPMFSNNERQTIRLLNTSDLGAGRITQDKVFGNRLYYRRYEVPWVAGGEDTADRGAPIKVELVYDVEVREAAVAAAKQLISTTADVPAGEFTPYLSESRMIPIKGRISELARGIKLPEGEPLRAGRAIYDHLVNTMVYNYLAPGAGQGNAVWACDSKTGDCTDFNSVFIGVCRWRGIPADHVFGLPMPPEKPAGEIKYCHCWARFWVADVGWIPIDTSRANTFPKDREYYFGTIGSTWVTLAHGRDVVLEPPQQGPPINMLHGPVAEIDGQPFEGVRWLAHYEDRQDAAAK